METESSGGQSLLEVISHSSAEGERKGVFHQLVVVSELGDALVGEANQDARTKLGEEYEQLFTQLQEHRNWVRISGVLLLYDTHALHVIESPPDVILDIAAAIRGHESEGTSPRLRNSRVLYSYDVATPTFPTYAFRSVQLASTMGYKMQESPELVAADCVVTINLLGSFLQTNDHGPEAALDNVHRTHPDLLCPQGMLEALCHVSELESVQAYVARLTKYLHITMDSDVVWPVPERLYPYD
eukprot:m.587432 g.587432  ORF g.587432 m.587432 type:complete len:242 (-) comp22352_c0_seq4:1926-2651(-)